jgi:translation initiation factor eIF-2B subunit delta
MRVKMYNGSVLADENALVKTDCNDEQPILADWKQSPNLDILNIMYDVTPSKYISLVIT